jgi:prefoldin subunit 5
MNNENLLKQIQELDDHIQRLLEQARELQQSLKK